MTVTLRCRFSRRTSFWPGISSSVASDPSVPVLPVALTRTVFLIASTDWRADAGKRTRIVYGRSLKTTGVGAGSPWSIALTSSSISCGVKPARAATAGSTRNSVAGPLIVFSIPSRTSTTPEIFLIASPTRGAHSRRSAGSCEKSLMAIGSGALVRSPIMS